MGFGNVRLPSINQARSPAGRVRERVFGMPTHPNRARYLNLNRKADYE